MSLFLAAAGVDDCEAEDWSDWKMALEWMDGFGGRKSKAGTTVTPGTANGLSAYYASIRNISEDVGKLPLRVYKETSDGKEVDRLHPVNRLLSEAPNEEMTPITFKETITAHCLGHGNGYAEIVRNVAGVPTGLYPVHPDNVTVMRDSRTKKIVYKVKNDGAFLREKDGYTIILTKDMLHIRGLGGDGLVGYSVVRFAVESLGAALATQNYAGSFFGNGLSLGGILEHPRKLGKEAKDYLIKSWEKRHKGSDQAHKVAILEEGMKWTQTTISPKEAEMIELRKFQTVDIARWFRIPPHKIGSLERATFSNIEHQAIEYVQDCLGPWLVRWEQEVDTKLLPERKNYPKFSVQALLRGDSKSRSEYYRNQLNLGAMSINEVRELEDQNSIGPDGDHYFMQLNMTTIDRIVSGESGKSTSDGFAGADAMRPVVGSLIKRINDKERKATARAVARANKGSEDLTGWYEDFTAEQLEYFVNSFRPVLSTMRLNGTHELAIRQYLSDYFAARRAGQDIDDPAMVEEILSILKGEHHAISR